MTRKLTYRCDHCTAFKPLDHAEGRCQLQPTQPIVPSDGWCRQFEKQKDPDT